jgi:hypothetical protein
VFSKGICGYEDSRDVMIDYCFQDPTHEIISEIPDAFLPALLLKRVYGLDRLNYVFLEPDYDVPFTWS